jgi:hypothetical protein
MPAFLLQMPCEFDGNYSVLIEDDGRVAYAFLMEYGDVIGDVWLYNQLPAPLDSNWVNQQVPYLNPAEYLGKDAFIAPLKNEREIRCEWLASTTDGSIEVGIYIRNRFIAQITSGSKPGWSVLVVKDGPLAQVY